MVMLSVLMAVVMVMMMMWTRVLAWLLQLRLFGRF
jgi:hypothetical protein